MKKILIILLFCQLYTSAQISLPYTNDFNHPNSDEDWIHYAISGTDNWERGFASISSNQSDFSWETKLQDDPSTYSIMVLESPSFDLTNANLPYALSFKYNAMINLGSLHFEYSIDNGTNWELFNPENVPNKNWQTASGFSLSTNGFTSSAIDLSSLNGYDNVKFRFKFRTYFYVNGYGCIIDDFSIGAEYYNIYATTGEPIEISPLSPPCSLINFKLCTNIPPLPQAGSKILPL